MTTRRNFIKAATATGLGLSVRAVSGQNNQNNGETAKPQIHQTHLRRIPRTGERIPSIGMGTWITFDVPENTAVRNQRCEVLKRFFEYGGGMIDSSPMYGSAENVLGYCLDRSLTARQLFAASKIWTPLAIEGPAQMSNTERQWGVDRMDLMYVHNMLNWEKHLPKLREWKSADRIRYLGISTSHGRRHDLLEKIIKSETLDFVQLTYNYDQRATEERLIPLAQDHGVAVIVNRPFQRGHLIDRHQSKPLPGIAKELGCNTWPQFLLLFAISHPGVTTAIPATSREDHMIENMSVMQLPMPDSAARQYM